MDSNSVKFAVIGAFAGACGLYAASSLRDRLRNKSPTSAAQPHAASVPADKSIFNEQVDRTRTYYGDEAFEKIRQSSFIVVGVGGVGSAAAHVLLRTGVKKIRLIDPDLVTLSSLNRNSIAERRDVGRPKVQVMKEHFLKICPETEIEIFETFFTEELAPILLEGNFTYVLDCIDNRETKVGLMSYCKEKNIPLISAFGAGSAHDPTKIMVCDLKDSFGCVFGKVLRRDLAKRSISTGIRVVCTTEEDKKPAEKLTAEEIELAKQGERKGIRVRKIGVVMPIPNIFGTIMANTVLSAIAGISIEYKQENRVPGSLISYQRLTKGLIKDEIARFHTSATIVKANFGKTEKALFVVEAFNRSSSISKAELNGTGRLCRWRPEQDIQIWNVVYLTQDEFDEHKKVQNVDAHYPVDVVARIDTVLADLKNK